jgi:hypothetical protein
MIRTLKVHLLRRYLPGTEEAGRWLNLGPD